MKKLFMAVTALFIMATTTMAQDNNANGEKKFDKTEMIQKRTDKMVEQYGLDNNQAKLLLTLNQEYADKMPMGGGRPGGHGPGMKKGSDSDNQQSGNRPSEEEMKSRMEEMKANMDAYNGELKKIMNDSQYAKYQENMKQRMQRGPHGDKDKKNNSEKE